MVSCKLKNDLEKLKKEKRELVNQAKNESLISEILLSKEPISKLNLELLDTMIGQSNMYAAKQLHAAYGKDEDIAELTTALKDAIYGDSQAALRMKYLKVSNPDPKFTAIDLSISDSDRLRASIASLNKDKSIAKLMKQFEQLDKLNVEIESDALSSMDRKVLQGRIDAINSRLDGSALTASLDAIPLLRNEKMFPAIYAVTQSYESKENYLKTKETRAAEGKDGYVSNTVDELTIENNTVDSKHGGRLSSEMDDEVSVLGMLFGVKGGNMIVLPPYVKNAIKINVLEKIEDVYKMLAYEPFSQEFDDVWGLDKNASTYEADLEAAQYLHLEGNIPQATILNSLGKAIYKSIPVQFSRELDVEMEQKAVSQLGMYALQYMDNVNLIKVGASVSFSDGKKNHIMIEANHNNRENSLAVKSEEIMALVSELQFLGATEGRTVPRRLDEIHEVSQTIRNSFIETSETVRENLKAFESTQLQFNDHMKIMYDMYKNPNGGKEAAYAMAGVLSVDTSKPVIDQMKELAKINYAKMQVDAMITAYEQFGDTEKFTLPYDYTVSGRYMINSVFNPQESKISRFLVTSTDLDSIIKRGSDGKLDAKDLQLFQVGISQSFDLDPDKTTDSKAIKDLEKIVVIVDNGSVSFKDTIDGKPNPFKTVYDMIVDGKLSGDISEDVKAAMMEVIRKGSGFHAMQAIMALKQLDDASKDAKGGDIKLAFSLESDAITSGMILTLMQIGTPKAMELASKGGVYTKDVIAHWEAMHGLYQLAGGKGKALPPMQDGSFKLTHGWLKEFSKDFKRVVELGNKGELLYASAGKQMQLDADLAIANGQSLTEFFASQAEFNDIYETVATTANKEMQLMKTKLADTIEEYESVKENLKGDDLKRVESEIRFMKLQQNMVEMVGSVKRSLAKPSVMVYIYGAMMDSIKKKMVDAIVMPKIYDVFISPSFRDMQYGEFKSLLETFKENPSMLENADPQFNASISLITYMLSGNAEVKFQKLDGNTFIKDNAQLMKNIVVSEKTAMKLNKIVNGTLGTAFEKGFSEFKEIDAYRDSVKSAEIVRFTMFKYSLDKGLSKVVKRMQDDGRYKVSSRDIASVINELEKNGFGHSVRDINGGKQPLYKKDALEKEVRTMLALMVGNPKSAALEGKEFAPNTGASGVITVHSIDGYIDSVSAKVYDLIRIYDGSVSGINQLNPSVASYNEVVLDTTRWNSYNTQANDLAKQIAIMEANGELDEMLSSLKDSDKDALVNTVEKLMGYGDMSELSIDDITKRKQEAVLDRVQSNYNFRNGGKTELSIMHSYLSDLADPFVGQMHSGSESQIEPLAVETLYHAYGKILKGLKQYKESLPSKEVAESSGSNEQVIDNSYNQVSNKQEMVEAIIAANKGTNADKHTDKELVKVAVATQYIGFGSKGSSTDRYRSVYGKYANTGKYTADDVIWVSSNGKRNGRVNPVDDNGELVDGYKLVDQAIESGATIVMDTVSHLRQTKAYNIGEMQLGKYLASHGYARVGESGEWKPKDPSRTTSDMSVVDGAITIDSYQGNNQVSNSQSKTAQDIVDMELSPAEVEVVNVIISDIKKCTIK